MPTVVPGATPTGVLSVSTPPISSGWGLVDTKTAVGSGVGTGVGAAVGARVGARVGAGLGAGAAPGWVDCAAADVAAQQRLARMVIKSSRPRVLVMNWVPPPAYCERATQS